MTASPGAAPHLASTQATPTHGALEFGTVMGYRPLELDLYLPAAAISQAPVPAPVIVFIHGGGWRVGSRRSFGPAFQDWDPSPFQRLADAGFAVASIDYRLSAEAVFPAQLDDVRTAAQWLAANADRFGIDAQRMVLWGESAGGHLAALLGLTGTGESTIDGGTAPPAARVVGVVDWYGPADLSTMREQSRADAVTAPDSPDSRESMLLGAPLADSPELAAAASPVTYVHADAPAFYLAHGREDRFVPTGQSEQLAAALRAAGASVRLRLVDGADHMWRGSSELSDIFTDALDFARSVV